MLHEIQRIVFTGMPVADVLISGPQAHDLMTRYGILPGIRNMLTAQQVAGIEAELPPETVTLAGGSMANTACTISRLCPGRDLRFLSICAEDGYGTLFSDAIRSAGLVLTPNETAGKETSRSYVITDVSGERGIARYMGDSMNFLDESRLERAIAGSDMLFLEGELLALPHGYDLWEALLASARRHNVMVGLTLFGAEQIRVHHAKYHETLPHTSLVFGNEEELAALYPGSSFTEGFDQLRSTVMGRPHGRVVCISHGDKPAQMATRDGTYVMAPKTVDGLVNTLGAGDAFMAGTLSGLLLGRPAEQAMQLGHRIAGAVIQQAGPQLEHPARYL
jgi:2-dehydro-3-deoxygluconokinase